MRTSGAMVLLIFYDVQMRNRMMNSGTLSKWFDRVVHWSEDGCAIGCHMGYMIRVDKETLEPSSFERGRVLTETTVLDQIEERLELSVNGHIFQICISESESFLRGSRRSCSCFAQPSVSADS
ncbi:hypothetical protein V6N12_045661 [Hibiscus sabdariffa]|uniref:Uncharacterized protein n=1 Tax=Hibiscus sabdariffa TaxID=183260 RepID=A0ABR2G402_9ROSI